MSHAHAHSRTRRRLLPVAFLAATLVLSACGGETQDDVESADDTATTAAADPTSEAAESTSDTAATESASPAAPETGSEAGSETGSEAAGGEIPEGLAMAYLPKQVNNPYFTTAATGANEAASEIGAEMEETGPSEASASSQVSYINTLTQQSKDAILLSANDPNAICPAVTKAQDAGIPVVTFDSDSECRDVFVNQATAEGIAEVQLQMVVDQVEGGEGQVAILSATPNATNQNAWIELMESMIADNDAYSGLEIVTIAYGNDDDQDSFQETQALLQSYPDLDAIISPTTVGIAAAARYLSDADFDVVLTGLGTPNQMREFVEDGTVGQFALWNPEDLGYLATWVGAQLVAGNITGEAGETFEAGKLGSYTIEEGGQVVLGPPTVFDESNIGDFDF